MRLYKTKRSRPLAGVAAAVAVFVLLATGFVYGINSVFARMDDDGYRAAVDAIDRAITVCYAVEGAYPADFNTLSERYGVLIDSNKYRVNFQAVGANIRPAFELVRIDGQVVQ